VKPAGSLRLENFRHSLGVGTGLVHIPGQIGSSGNRPNRPGSQWFGEPCLQLKKLSKVISIGSTVMVATSSLWPLSHMFVYNRYMYYLYLWSTSLLSACLHSCSSAPYIQTNLVFIEIYLFEHVRLLTIFTDGVLNAMSLFLQDTCQMDYSSNI
jgi:hypothetical protein